jgi:DNA repair exonuclease SbcCD ATPase subunit
VALTTIADLIFAGGVVLAALTLAAAALHHASRSLLAAATVLEAAGAVGIWVAFALRHDRPLAVAAGGLTACTLAAGAALLLRRALKRVGAMDERLSESQADLLASVEREKTALRKELELTLARARADSRSLLEEQERQIAEERRSLVAQREHDASAALGDTLNQVQTQIEQRLAEWSQEHQRNAEATKTRIVELEQRQQQLLREIELRLTADSERLSAESEEQRAGVARLRADLNRTLEDALAVVRSELEAHSAERRRALQDLESRFARRERELSEQAQREEADAVQRVRAGFEDVSRRQVEQLERAVDRAVASHADEAAQRFAQLVKSSREDAAKRLARELERAVSAFSREAETVLAERLAHVGDAGAQRLEHRVSNISKELERRQDELVAAHDLRLGELEAEIRRRVDELRADVEAERGVLEARLQELLRRVGSAAAVRGS